MTEYRDVWYRSIDDLQLYARDYPHPAPRATLLCLHGLTRNSADFGSLCETLNGDYRVIAPDQRGRGRSQYDPEPTRYHLETYVQDMFTMLAQLELEHVVAIGTSMGGLMTMVMAALRPGCVRAVVLNDVGPVVDTRGLARIRSYVGKTPPPRTWTEAARIARQTNGVAFPDYTDADWMAFARRIFRENSQGEPEPAYDPAIAEPLQSNQAAVAPNLWPIFDALKSIPALLIRGATSDILSLECVAQMRERKPDLRVVEVSGRGHAPMLDEPEAVDAIHSFLASVA